MSQPLDTPPSTARSSAARSSAGRSGTGTGSGPATEDRGSAGARGAGHPDHSKARMLALVSVVLGVLAALTAWSHSIALVGIVLGVVSVPLGLWAQMISTETSQRVIAVLGMTAGGFGLAMGVAHGGLPFT